MGGFPSFYTLALKPVDTGNDDCNISILTTLASPRSEFINSVRPGDILIVSIGDSGALEAITQEGNICGFIVSSISRIKSCIEKGNQFEAIITMRDKAECQVLIQKQK